MVDILVEEDTHKDKADKQDTADLLELAGIDKPQDDFVEFDCETSCTQSIQ
jgi:hypothetical protein